MIPAIGMQVYGEAIRRIEQIHEESLEKEKKLVSQPRYLGCQWLLNCAHAGRRGEDPIGGEGPRPILLPERERGAEVVSAITQG